eukprot:TRINITY_DN7789_c0_g1_i1.p1 TRINITY_DN7789_c0_g1~~TRINITY_DN7789_c0_g1_i1.p1  ORF type:complete len:146 (-),score=15.29 TRINITY_DN7789_c0_g1_i1:78-515(-)
MRVEGSTFVMQENIYRGTVDEELPDSREQSFSESLQTLQVIAHKKDSKFKPLTSLETSTRNMEKRAPPSATRKGDDLRRQALLNMHKISISERGIPYPMDYGPSPQKPIWIGDREGSSDQSKVNVGKFSSDEDNIHENPQSTESK